MQNCKSISAFVAMFYNQLLHCNVCTLHCSIIKCIVRNDDVSFTRKKRVNEHLYTFQEEVQFPCKISGPLFTWFTCFDISMACIIMGLIIIIFSRSKRVNKNIIYLCTRSDGNLLTCKISSSLELRLVRFVFSKEDEEEEDEEDESVKIMFYLYFVPCVIISYNFLHAVTF